MGNAKRQILEIFWTKDYDRFKFYKMNREVDYHHCEKKIQESLLVHGWLKSFPMIVDRDLRIRDGQHRFVIAKKLGLEIPVMIVEHFDDEDMFCINNASKRWTSLDFLHYHMQRGDKNAKILYDLAKDYKLSVRFILTLAHFNHNVISMSSATFRDFNKAEMIKKINLINEISDFIKLKSERINCALVTIIEHPQYDHNRFLAKLDYQRDKIHRCTNVSSYIDLFQEIYNYRASEKIVFTKRG